MADTMISDMPTNTNPTRSKKGGRARKALKPTNQSPDEPVASARAVVTTPPEDPAAGKENHESLSQPKKTKSKKKPSNLPSNSEKELEKSSNPPSNFEKELEEMQEKLQRLRIEKEQTEEMVKARDEMLKQKDEEIKKLHKIKEFKPTMTFPIALSVGDKEPEKKEKKKGCTQMKRPSPPYVLWCKDQWNEIKKANPEAEFKDISAILGAKWKTVTAEEKKPYEEKYQAEKEAYLKVVGNEKRENEAMKLLEEEQKQRTAMELLEQYLQFKQEAVKETKKKKEKDPLKPKQPMSAFFVFANARRAALVAENKSVVEVAKITGEEWKNMTEKQKKPYEKIAKENKEKYTEEMEAYKQKKEEEAINLKKEDEEQMKIQKQEALQLLKKKEKAENIIKKTKENRQKKKQQKEEKNADPNKPKKPASSFILFSKETKQNLMEERPGINNSTLTALISVKWKELSEQDKIIWNEKAAKAMEAYKKELEEYNKTTELKEK